MEDGRCPAIDEAVRGCSLGNSYTDAHTPMPSGLDTVKKSQIIPEPGSSATVFAVTGFRKEKSKPATPKEGETTGGMTVLQQRLNAALEK